MLDAKATGKVTLLVEPIPHCYTPNENQEATADSPAPFMHLNSVLDHD